jgi:hypothetical protein
MDSIKTYDVMGRFQSIDVDVVVLAADGFST